MSQDLQTLPEGDPLRWVAARLDLHSTKTKTESLAPSHTQTNGESTVNLDTLSDRQLIEVGCAINGGAFGRDPARMNKNAKMAYLRDLARERGVDMDATVERALGIAVAQAARAPRAPVPALDAPAPGEEAPASGGDVFEMVFTHEPAASAEEDRVDVRPPKHARSRSGAARDGHGPAPADDAAARLRDALAAFVPAPQAAPMDEERVREIACGEAASAVDGIASAAATAIVEAEQRVLAVVDERLAAIGGAAAVPLDLSGIGGAPKVETAGKHPIFPLVLALAALPHELRPNVLLTGPAGSGKSTLARHVAEALGRPFAAISLSAGATESVLTCRILPIHEGGRFGSVDSLFLDLYGKPSVVLLDEMDAADPNVILVANAALANGGFFVEARAVDGRPTYVERSEKNVVLAAANTFLTGADAQYVGRGALDAATVDRFLLIEIGYNETLEASLCGVTVPTVPPWKPTASTDASAIRADMATFHAWFRAVRARINERGIKRVWSTRAVQKAIALRVVGCGLAEIESILFAGWRADERSGLPTIGSV